MDQEFHWWQKAQKKESVHGDVFQLVKRLDEELQLEQRYADWLSVLLHRYYTDLKPHNISFGTEIFEPREELVINAMGNILETLTSRICTHRPRPRFITSDGDWSVKRKAQKLDRFVEGIFQRHGVYEHTTQAFRDAAWCGTGFVKVCPDPARPGEIVVERCFPYEIVVDQRGCMHGEPNTVYQRKWVPSEVLLEQFPKRKHRRAIADSTDGGLRFGPSGIFTSDMVQVIEAWHLPSGPGAKDGVHTISVENGDLVNESYEADFFPFAVFRWSRVPVGFYGQGLVEQLMPTQAELNKLVRRVQEAMQLFATAWVVMPEGACKKEHLRNLVGSILEVKPGMQGQVQIVTPPSMNSQVFDWIGQLYELTHELSGVSQMSATGKKPAGIEAAVALRELRDLEDTRLGQPFRHWENFHLDIARLTIRTAKGMHTGDDVASDYEVKHVGRRFYQSIKWSDVALEDDAYVLQLWPTNLLPSTPAGRLATTEELMAAGLIDKQTAMTLLDFPDTERTQHLASTTIDIVDWAVEKMLDSGEPVDPSSALHIPVAIRRAGHHLLQAEMDGAPEDRLLLLRDYLEQISMRAAEVQDAMDAVAMKEQMAQQGPAPPPPDSPIPAPPEVPV